MPWARFDDMLPVHPKVRALTDSAFRLYISAICWCNCNQTDGYVPSKQLQYVSDVRRPRHCADQLVEAGLWDQADGGWQIHDYLEYQPSAAKVKRERELKRQRQERWRAHVDASPQADVDASLDVSDDASSRARAHPIPSRSGSVGNQPADRNARAPEDVILIRAVQQTLAARTGRQVTDDVALAAALQILGSESVRNPVAYVTAALNRDPNPRRFLPASHPAGRTLSEALVVAGVSPNGQPARGETVTSIAEQIRASLAHIPPPEDTP